MEETVEVPQELSDALGKKMAESMPDESTETTSDVVVDDFVDNLVADEPDEDEGEEVVTDADADEQEEATEQDTELAKEPEVEEPEDLSGFDTAILEQLDQFVLQNMQQQQAAPQQEPSQQAQVQQVQPPAAPAAPQPSFFEQQASIPLVSQDVYEAAMNTREGFSQVMHQYAQQVRAETEKNIINTILPQVDTLVARRLSAQSVVSTYLDANPDLKPVQNMLLRTATQLNQQDPNMDLREVMKTAGKTTRDWVKGLMRQQKAKQAGRKPAAKTPMASTASRQPTQLSKFDSERKALAGMFD